MSRVYIVDGCRTPIGKKNGILAEYLPEELGAVVLNHILKKNKLDSKNIDEVILGNAVGPGGNIARLSLLEAGWHTSVPATTIDYQCASGLKSIMMGSWMIKASQADLVIAGGVESTSMEPARRYNPRDPRFEGADVFYPRAQFSPKHVGDPDMLTGAENTGELFDISRHEMDRWAFTSHTRAAEAKKHKRFKEIVLPLGTDQQPLPDEGIREKISMRVLAKAKPVVKKNGNITCGNACLTHDGACGLLLASESAIEKYGLEPIVEIEAVESVGVDPNYPPIGALEAAKKLIAKAKLNPDAIDAYEVNEAFAVKILAFIKGLGISEKIINKWGGGLAYGHPYGASGAVITLHLVEILKQENSSRGLAAIAAAGGQGTAILIKNVMQGSFTG